MVFWEGTQRARTVMSSGISQPGLESGCETKPNLLNHSEPQCS